ncbi:MAG TPA: flagellar filament capping protein FliD [Candidatus Baltobacteraceae bacterium]|nr:flagellar filament capping protein FliD [Candidatus Baltobacteraceae bacterium]
MSASNVPGTNVPPISFPGVVSGIDYNAIITQLTKLSLAPTIGLNASVATLNQANVELTKINNLLQSVQNSLVTLSNPNLYGAYSAVSSNSALVSASGIAGTAGIPGVYTITKVQTATATSVTSNAAAGHGITDVMTSGPYTGTASDKVPLASSYAAITPTNGGGSLGQITVDGVSISYNVNTQSLDQILGNITNAVQVKADAGFLATVVNGVVQFTSSDQPISVGASGDAGNLLDVLRLSNSQLNNTPGSGSLVGTADVGGINQTESFGATNAAGFVTPVTGGFFTINGVKVNVSTGDNTADVLSSINSSGAGVVATFNTTTGQINLTASTTGPQSIVIGAAGDTSNFLTAAGLTPASGATTQIGSQAEVDVQTAGGGTQKYFSNSNTVTNAIQGISLNLQSSFSGGTPVTISVAQDTSGLVSALQGFTSAYNAAVSEINSATAPPTIVPAAPGSGGAAQSIGGGVLFGRSDAQSIVQMLTQIVGGFLGSGTSYNSLSQVGLQLSDTFQTLTTSANSNTQTGNGGQNAGNNTTSPVQSTTYQGTDGTLQSLDMSKFISAFTANPSAVSSLLNGTTGLTATLGNYLTGVTGAPTLLDSGPVGLVPTVSVIQNYENSNTDQISNYQQQIQQITDSANQQANNLRSQFVASEALIAQLQAEQQQLAAALGFTISSSSSSGK